MITRTRIFTLSAVLVCLALVGCAPPFVITQDLQAPLVAPGNVKVGEITDLLGADVAVDDRPTSEDVQKFKEYLEQEFLNRKHLGLVFETNKAVHYEIQGRLLEYTKGSGLKRFLFGFGAGAASVLTELKLVDVTTGETVFAGNFRGLVTDGLESGDRMFKNVAREFSNELEKQTGKRPSTRPASGL